MIQKSIIAHSNTLRLDIPLPTSYVGKEINLLLYSSEELEKADIDQDKKDRSKKWKFSTAHVNVSDYKFNREEANER
jgi:hypothetical protein